MNINKYRRSIQILRFSLIIVIVFLFSSCVTHRNLEYMQYKDTGITLYNDSEIPDYKLKPWDELYIDIKSLDDPTTNVFQQVGKQQSSTGYGVTPYSASLSSYMIDKSGYLELPFIGNILVENKTIPEVTAMLTDSLNNILSNPTVTVKLVNRYVSVFGEVKNPGHFSYAQEKLTIFGAISLAGDLTDYGDRNDIVLVRNENGNNLRINVDLTSPNILASEYYYIRPNDMLYVKPLNKKFWGLNQFPWSLLLSSISTAVLLYTAFGK